MLLYSYDIATAVFYWSTENSFVDIKSAAVKNPYMYFILPIKIKSNMFTKGLSLIHSKWTTIFRPNEEISVIYSSDVSYKFQGTYGMRDLVQSAEFVLYKKQVVSAHLEMNMFKDFENFSNAFILPFYVAQFNKQYSLYKDTKENVIKRIGIWKKYANKYSGK